MKLSKELRLGLIKVSNISRFIIFLPYLFHEKEKKIKNKKEKSPSLSFFKYFLSYFIKKNFFRFSFLIYQ